MRRQSIKKSLFRFTAILLAVLFLFQIGLLFLYNVTFQNVKSGVDHQNLYTMYETRAASLRDCVAEYYDSPSRETLDYLEEQKQELTELADKIAQFFDTAQFEDNRILTLAYTDKVEELIDCMEADEGDPFSAYKECDRVYNLMIKQHRTTLSFEMSILSEKLNQIFDQWNFFYAGILVLLGLIFLLILLCTSRQIQKIVGPLSFLSNHAKEFESRSEDSPTQGEGQSADIKDSDYSEIIILYSALTHMENTIKRQIEALKDKYELSQKVHALEIENMSAQVALAQTENSLMQSLINPHFLFNCLNLLASFAIIEKAPTVHEYSVQIANYLRKSLSYVGKQITLEKEFSFLEDYVAIQKLRFGSRITFELDCDAECGDGIIPAIILQPLLENSLVHGVGSYLHNGFVRASVQKTDDEKILLQVCDNGCGFTAERLQEVREQLNTPFQPGEKGTGIRSVLYRLNYFFSEEIVAEIESDSEKTKISFVIPYREERSR